MCLFMYVSTERLTGAPATNDRRSITPPGTVVNVLALVFFEKRGCTAREELILLPFPLKKAYSEAQIYIPREFLVTRMDHGSSVSSSVVETYPSTAQHTDPVF